MRKKLIETDQEMTLMIVLADKDVETIVTTINLLLEKAGKRLNILRRVIEDIKKGPKRTSRDKNRVYEMKNEKCMGWEEQQIRYYRRIDSLT